jgi:hypothetical protein
MLGILIVISCLYFKWFFGWLWDMPKDFKVFKHGEELLMSMWSVSRLQNSIMGKRKFVYHINTQERFIM